jgi:hypothetical protein
VIDVKNFPFLGPIMDSLGEKQAKRCLTEFSGVPAYTPNKVIAETNQRYREYLSSKKIEEQRKKQEDEAERAALSSLKKRLKFD